MVIERTMIPGTSARFAQIAIEQWSADDFESCQMEQL
jgi:hypothetical protein